MLKKSIQADVVLSESKKHQITTDIVFLVFIFILSIIFVHELSFYDFDKFSTVIMLIFLVASLSYQFIKNEKLTRMNYLLWIFMVIAILPNYIYSYHYGLKFVNLIFVNVILAYWFMSCAKHQIKKEESDWILMDMLIAVLHAPFILFKTITDCIKHHFLWNTKQGVFIKIIIGLFISIPVLIISITLLSSADAMFNYYVSQVDFKLVLEWGITIVFAIPIFYYYGAISYGHLSTKERILYEEEKVANKISKLSSIPQMVFTTMECLLVLTYLLFIIASIQSLLSNIGMNKDLFSYSNFARQGFFELCMISTLNLVLLLGIRLLSKDKNAFSYGIEKILIFETLLIIVSAMIKMIMYIQVYDAFTYLRIYASWLMITLFGIFLLLLLQRKNSKYKVLPIVSFVCVSFLCLNLCNISYWASDSTLYTNAMDDIGYYES